MLPVEYRNRLAATGKTLIQEDYYFDVLKASLDDLTTLLIELSSVDIDSDDNRTDIILENGIAVGLRWTVACIIDIIRTKSYVRGLYLAIQQKLAEGKLPVRVLYAGCGPFATLVMPLTQVFSAEQVQFSLIEINPTSAANIQQIIKHLELEPYFPELLEVDATVYQIPVEQSYDILVTETMQHALLRELQVPITLHLINQLPKETILIPEQIELSLGLLGGTIAESDRRISLLGSFFTLDKETVPPTMEGKEQVFTKVKIALPKELPQGQPTLCVFTQIKTFGGEEIGYFRSGLTIPHILFQLDDLEVQPTSIDVQYRMKEEPYIWSALCY